MQETVTLTFTSGADKFEIEIGREGNEDSPSYGDARLQMVAHSSGFSGSAWCLIERDDLDGFASALQAMSETVSGKAELASMSPGELSLKIHQLSARGVFGIEAQIGRHVYQEDHRHFWHSVSFGFELEFSQIEKTARQLQALITTHRP